MNIKFSSRYIRTNKKTIVSVDIPFFGKRIKPCQLMDFVKAKDVPGTKAKDPEKELLVPRKCEGCYAASLLNTRIGLRNSLLNVPPPDDHQLELFKQDLSILKALGIKRLRFFSWTDFTPETMPFILATAEAGIEAHIISKMLATVGNEEHLRTLFNAPNVIISLSFNKDWHRNLQRIIDLLLEKEPDNVQLNYTTDPKKERDIEGIKKIFQVLHLKNKDKRKVAEMFGIPETQACGVFGIDGSRVATNGSCNACNNCNLSFINHLKGIKAELPALLQKIA